MSDCKIQPPNQPEPTAVGADCHRATVSAIAVHVTSRRWLRFFVDYMIRAQKIIVSTIGSLICVLAILHIFGLITHFVAGRPPDTIHLVQELLLIVVLLLIGIPLSLANKKPKDQDKK